MKKYAIATLLITVLTTNSAEAWGRGHHHNHYYDNDWDGAYGAIAGIAIAGAAISLLSNAAQPNYYGGYNQSPIIINNPPVYYQPAPVYYQQPVVYTQPTYYYGGQPNNVTIIY